MTSSSVPRNPLKMIGRANRAFTRVADLELRELGFAMGQLPVLMGLKHGQRLTQMELARLAQVEQPSMAQLLNRMERDGLVERVADAADKRSRLITLTPTATKRMPKAKAVMDALAEQALAGFSATEIAQLENFLVRLNGNIDRMGGDGVAP